MKQFRLRVCIAVASAAASLSACRTPAGDDAALKAVVTPDQFGRAMAAVKETRAYVPYAEPGTCEARATWLAALLGAERIPTSKRYVFAPSNTEKLKGPNGVPWDFHVGIMIRANDSHEHMILDPTWGDDWLLVDWKWRQRMTGNPAAYQLDVPGSTDGAEIRHDYRNRNSVVVDSFAAMPKYKMATLEKACGTLVQFLNTVPGLNYELADAKLKSEMLRIADALQAHGVLDWGSLTQGSIYCGSKKIR